MFQEIAAQIAFSPSLPYVATALGVTSIGGLLGWRWWQRKNTYKSLESLPCPPKHWLLGNLPQLLAAVKQKKFFQFLFDWSKQLGPIYVLWLNSPVLVLSQPKVIENTIVNGIKDGSLVRSERICKVWNDFGGGPILIGQNGTEWQWRRKAWNPEFNSSSLSKYFDIINLACEQVIARLQQDRAQTEVKVDFLFVELTMKVIFCLVIGIPVDGKSSSSEGPPLDILKAHEAMSIFGYRALRLITGEKRWMKYLPTKASRDYWRARRYLEGVIGPRVDLALKMRAQNLTNWNQVSPMFQESMLVKIAAREGKYTRKTLIAEAIQLLMAGTDTTAHTLSFAVGALTLNPKVFQKAQAVVDQSWQSNGGINTESLKKLTYIGGIIKETLRLYSVTSGSASLQAQRDTVIEGNLIPRGTTIRLSMLAAGRDPEVYANPEEFLPERWLDQGKGSSPLPMINFGSGFHRCLGEHLAMLEATVMLAMLLRYFDWELVNGRSSVEQLQQNLFIYPSDGMPVRFKARDLQCIEETY
ncbi:MAG: cytochrome P450 [Moorea sp. SIO3I7]|uniref:cytochrome P450 n=1 Tax=Moorena sp. SIO4A5 TaxID=2607838 RepID=UPI0013CC6B22|nr:cytochrome P450 [Moorena sp. SIO4A5]NEN98153.1 cytochrome P450 [Moorena sp. SIO3I7]NEO24492.1 cytochrome P450 [Moorena sp. SIO4A5]NEO61860.1 cytochrome P450 [Moorena sp. SIO4G2]